MKTLVSRNRPIEMWAAIRGVGGGVLSRGDSTLVIDDVGLFINHRTLQPVGVDAWVRLFRFGQEVPVDPHRIFINPPLFHRGRFAPVAAFESVLWDSVIGSPNPKGWRTRGTVTTVFATAPGGNGYARNAQSSYSAARTAPASAVGGDHLVGQTTSGPTSFTVYEAFVIFDTSSIPDTDDISIGTLSLDGLADVSTTNFTVVAAISAYDGGQVVVGDFVSGDSLGALTAVATWSSAGYSSAYNAFTSDANMLTSINKTGNTSIILFSANTRDNVAPTNDEWVGFTDADASGTSTDPKLEITHAAGATANGPLVGARHLVTSGILSGRLAN